MKIFKNLYTEIAKIPFVFKCNLPNGNPARVHRSKNIYTNKNAYRPRQWPSRGVYLPVKGVCLLGGGGVSAYLERAVCLPVRGCPLRQADTPQGDPQADTPKGRHHQRQTPSLYHTPPYTSSILPPPHPPMTEWHTPVKTLPSLLRYSTRSVNMFIHRITILQPKLGNSV